MYDKKKLLDAIDLVCQACEIFNNIPQELEPLSHTEPINKMVMALDEFLDGAKRLIEIMNKEDE